MDVFWEFGGKYKFIYPILLCFQYMFHVEKPSDKFIFSLEQEDTVVGQDARQKLMSIGFVIMKVSQVYIWIHMWYFIRYVTILFQLSI